MVDGEQEHLLVRSEGRQRGPTQRSLVELKRGRGLRDGEPARRTGGIALGAQIADVESHQTGAMDHLPRLAGDRDDAGAERLMAALEKRERRGECRCLDVTAQSPRAGDVVCRRVGVHLVEHPETTLGVRHRIGDERRRLIEEPAGTQLAQRLGIAGARPHLQVFE